MKGKVVRVNAEKGFGFVISDEDAVQATTETVLRGLSRFFHASDVVPLYAFDLLRAGTPVTFEAEAAPDTTRKGNGLRAKKVQVIK